MIAHRNPSIALGLDTPTSVRREVDLPAPPAEVWASLATAERFGAWFGADVQVELRPRGRLTFRWPGGLERGAIFEDVSPERALAFRWLPFVTVDGRRQPTVGGRVEFELEPTADGTRLTVTEWTSLPRSPGAP